MSIVIHVGLHKTGTTFLQEQIFKKLKNINYSKKIDLHRIHIDNNKINLISNAWLSSDEPHFYEFGATDKYEILSHIKKLFPDAKIILVKRNFSPWLKSCYRQYIVSGGILTFDDYCEKYNHNFIDMDDYENMIRELFDEVLVTTQESLLNNREQTIQTICNFIGVEVPIY